MKASCGVLVEAEALSQALSSMATDVFAIHAQNAGVHHTSAAIHLQTVHRFRVTRKRVHAIRQIQRIARGHLTRLRILQALTETGTIRIQGLAYRGGRPGFEWMLRQPGAQINLWHCYGRKSKSFDTKAHRLITRRGVRSGSAPVHDVHTTNDAHSDAMDVVCTHMTFMPSRTETLQALARTRRVRQARVALPSNDPPTRGAELTVKEGTMRV